MPIAASTNIVAAVVIPIRPPASRKIAPAPRKPMPCTIFEAIRVLPVSPNRRAISPERMVNNAVARQTKRLVRMPAGRRRRSRSIPMTVPSAAATVKRKNISWRESMALVSHRPPVRDSTHLQFELRQFRKMPCSGVYLFGLQVPQPLQSEFLDCKTPQHRTVDHGSPQGGVASILAAREVSHEAPGKTVTGARGIVRLFQRKRWDAKYSPFVHHHGSVFPALDHQRRWAHLENLLGRTQQVVLVRKLARFRIVDH